MRDPAHLRGRSFTDPVEAPQRVYLRFQYAPPSSGKCRPILRPYATIMPSPGSPPEKWKAYVPEEKVKEAVARAFEEIGELCGSGMNIRQVWDRCLLRALGIGEPT